MKGRNRTQLERGVGLAEFTIGALVFFMSLFAVLECCRLLWTHNALADATRRGARYAALNTQNVTNVKNFVVYGTASPAVGAAPVVYGLTTSNVAVSYSGFGVKQGTVTVQITSYQFTLNIPLANATFTMPAYKTTLTGESAGYVPANL